jgi:hypothetical protein
MNIAAASICAVLLKKFETEGESPEAEPAGAVPPFIFGVAFCAVCAFRVTASSKVRRSLPIAER